MHYLLTKPKYRERAQAFDLAGKQDWKSWDNGRIVKLNILSNKRGDSVFSNGRRERVRHI